MHKTKFDRNKTVRYLIAKSEIRKRKKNVKYVVKMAIAKVGNCHMRSMIDGCLKIVQNIDDDIHRPV